MPTQGALTIREQGALQDKFLDKLEVWNEFYELGIRQDRLYDILPDLIEVVGTEVRLEFDLH